MVHDCDNISSGYIPHQQKMLLLSPHLASQSGVLAHNALILCAALRYGICRRYRFDQRSCVFTAGISMHIFPAWLSTKQMNTIHKERGIDIRPQFLKSAKDEIELLE